jgi:ribonuclease D
MAIILHQNDLPHNILQTAKSIAIDTETTGLVAHRDRLCLVQISDGLGDVHLVQFVGRNHAYDCPNLKKILTNDNILKIFHFARFDIMMLEKYLNIKLSNIFCTKIASKITRTFTDRHGLRDLARDLINVDISKQQQTSDWGSENLSEAQQTYAAGDVLYLHQLKSVLDNLLVRENRTELAQACFDFLPTRSRLDLLGWDQDDKDFFSHS